MPDDILPESPILSLERAVVCLHLLEARTVNPDDLPRYPDCPVIASMEIDLLSRQVQDNPPLGSQCESHGRIPIEIVFPAAARYRSEGRLVELICQNPDKEADLILSSTTVQTSGMRIWHAAIVPRSGAAFSELDIIKLIHLYDGRSERSNLADAIKFRLDAGPERSGLYSLSGLLGAVVRQASRERQEEVGEVQLRGGTVQILTNSAVYGDVNHSDLLEAAALASDPLNKSAMQDVVSWTNAGSVESSILAAYCGIVTGILDYPNMGAAEIIDSLEPSVTHGPGLTRFHGTTLTHIAVEDRVMTACADTVGISPYLIIPHAALLHNEAQIEIADQTLELALTDRSPRLTALESAAADARRRLNRLRLPNVFNYRSERELYEKGEHARGYVDRRNAAAATLEELNGRIKTGWAERTDRGQMIIAILLAVMSLLQLKDLVFALMGPVAGPAARWSALTALVACLIVGMAQLWRLGSPRGHSSNY